MYLILFTGVLLSFLFYLTGSLFIEGKIKRENSFLQNVINFWIGLLLVVAVYAIFKTSMVTSMVLVLLVLVLFRVQFRQSVLKNPISVGKFAFVFATVYAFAFFTQVNFQLDVFERPLYYLEHIHADDEERIIYSHIISILHYHGVESIRLESMLSGFTGVSLYHFPEFWLASLFKTLYNGNSDLVLFYFVYPLFKTFAILTIYSLYAEKLDSVKRVFLGIFIIIGFVILGLRWIFPPLSVIDLRSIVMLPILILAAKMIYDKRYDTACAMLLIASVENVLFLPAAMLFLLLFFDKLDKRTLYSVVIFFVYYSLFFLLFKEKGTDKYMSLSLQEIAEIVIDDTLGTRLYRFFLIAFLSYPFRVLLTFLLVNNYSDISRRVWVRNLGYWFLICFLSYHFAFVVFTNLSVDAIQLRTVGLVTACIAFFFMLARLIDQGKYLVCLVIMLLVSDYTYPIGAIKVERPYDPGLEQKLSKLGQGRTVRGLFIDENEELANEFYLDYYPTHVTEYSRANDYRLFLFAYDVEGLKKSIRKLDPGHQRIVSKVIQPIFHLDRNILENIKSHSISIVWVNKESKYLSEFKDLQPVHELENHLVYYFPVDK